MYLFNEGYWGPNVGFYGGINYGYGYFGNGYWGGRWEGNMFRYNTAVTHVNTNIVHNTYVDRSVVNKQVNANRASFNGPNGVKAEPTAEQKAAAANAKKTPPTSEQLARQEAAKKDQNLHASANKGQPKPDAIKPRPGVFCSLHLWRPAEDWTEHDILYGILPRQEGVLLKHINGIAVDRIELATAAAHRPGRWLQKSCNEIQDRRFPTPGRADERNELASRDLK